MRAAGKQGRNPGRPDGSLSDMRLLVVSSEWADLLKTIRRKRDDRLERDESAEVREEVEDLGRFLSDVADAFGIRLRGTGELER